MPSDFPALPMAPMPMMGGADMMPAGDMEVPEAKMQLTRPQKAAVVVRLLISNGVEIPLENLPEDVQSALTHEVSQLGLIDKDTLAAVAAEFAEAVEGVGLTSTGGMAGALGVLDGHISAATANRMRREAGVAAKGDPWERIAGIGEDQLFEVLEQESLEISAVLLSKMDVSKAAALLGRLPGERARAISYAISLTAEVSPEVVRRIGLTLAAQFDAKPILAFKETPVDRVGAILNFSPSATRDDVLAGLEEEDAVFAEEVKKAIFTFANIPTRVATRDIPKVVRGIDQADLVKALKAAEESIPEATEFILANMSQRMADSLRDEMADMDKPKSKDADAAMNAVVSEVRRLAEAAEILLLTGDDEDD